MVETMLLAISLMWIPIGLLLLGKGEAKVTGALTMMVGTFVIIASLFQAAVFNDPWLAALFFSYGLFYNAVGYGLFSGATDMRSVGNASVTVALITIVYIILSLTGAPLLAKSNFLALAATGYLGLYIMVWLNAYGKLSDRLLGWSLIIWTFVGLWLPGFWLLALGKLPF